MQHQISAPARESHLHLQPAGVEEELQEGEDGDVDVEVVALVTLSGVEELTTNQTSKEKGVDGKSDNLKRERERERLHCISLPLFVWEL